MRGFIEFIREQSVVGLAVGFILGGSVSKLVDSLVKDIINPVLGIFIGVAGDLANYSFLVGKAEIRWGNFVMILINFIVVAAVVYFGVKGLQLDRLDKKKK